MQRVRDFGVLSPGWDIFITCLPEGTGIYTENGVGENLDRFRTEKLPAPRRGSGHKVTSQPRNYLLLISAGRGKICFSNEMSLCL